MKSMSTRVRRALIALSLFLMFMPLALFGYMAGMGRAMTPPAPKFVPGQDQYRGAAYCQTCHPQQYEEWQTSLMANATTEALFEHRSRQLAWMMPQDRCLACHAPLVGQGVEKEESISCEVCHGPGRTEAVVGMFCLACHQGSEDFILTTGSEYGASPAAKRGETCESCHMPEVDGRHSHRFAGSRAYPESYRGVVVVEGIALEDEGIAVTVKNTVDGHSLPTGTEAQIIYLEVTGYDAAGRVVYRQEHAFMKSVFFMGTIPMQITGDNRLEAGEVRRVLFETEERPARLEATIKIKPVGLDGVRREFVVHQQEIVFR
jgi:hypothetical protein